MSQSEASRVSVSEWVEREGFGVPGEGWVDRVVQKLGERAELLGLGEGLHGGEEILLLRNAMFRRLAEGFGYSAIALESSFTRGFAADAFVSGRGEWESAESAGFSHGFGRLAANRELMEWIRGWNAGVPAERRVRVYGFDMPGDTGPVSPAEAMAAGIEGVALVDAGVAGEMRARVAGLIGEEARWGNPMDWMDPAKSGPLVADAEKLRVEAQKVVMALRSRKGKFGDADAYAKALRHAEVAREQANFCLAMAQGKGYSDALAARDVIMAGNLEYICARETGRGKVMAFGHNAHLQRGKVSMAIGGQECAWPPAGAHLKETMGEKYAVVGTGVGRSEENGIAGAEEGTLEEVMLRGGGEGRVVMTGGGRGVTGAEAMPARSGSVRNPTYVPLKGQSWTDFDAVVVLGSAKYWRGGRTLPVG